jgi:hypothetical protein
MKHVAFDVTPKWWGRAPTTAKQLVVAAAGELLPQCLQSAASVFAVGDSVFAYDISVPENVPIERLAELRARIVAEIEAVRALLPSAWLEATSGRAASSTRVRAAKVANMHIDDAP